MTDNNQLLPSLPIDYVTKDYDGFFQMMKDMIPTLTPEWTDTNDSDMGIVLLQLLSYGLHVLGYYEDRAINENILHLARTRKTILYLAKFLGYEPATQTPATVDITFTKDDTTTGTYLSIPARTQVSTDPQLGDPIIFETDDTLILDASTDSGTISCTQGQTVLDESVGVGDGTAGQSYKLQNTDVIQDTIEIITNENNVDYYWDKVDNFMDSLPSDRHFTADVDEENYTTITFGDGTFGMRPLSGSAISSNYRFGGGTVGNLASGLINYLFSPEVDGIATVNNANPSTGGTDYEDLDHIKTMAPKNYRTGGKAVTPLDFEDIAETVSGVSSAVCVETFNANNDVNVYIATTDYTPATQTLLDSVKSTLDAIRVLNANLNVLDCTYVSYDLSITVEVYSNYSNSDIQNAVQDDLNTFLSPANFSFGDTVHLSQIVQRVFQTTGVKNVVVTTPTADVTTAQTELPKLGTLTVTVNGGF